MLRPPVTRSRSPIQSGPAKPPKAPEVISKGSASQSETREGTLVASSHQPPSKTLAPPQKQLGPPLIRTNTLTSIASRSSVSSKPAARPNPKPPASPTARDELNRVRDNDDPHERLLSRSPDIKEALQYIEALTEALMECRQLIARDRTVLEEAAAKKRYRNSTAEEMAREREILNRLETLTDRVSLLVSKRTKIQTKLEAVRNECIKMTLRDRIVGLCVLPLRRTMCRMLRPRRKKNS